MAGHVLRPLATMEEYQACIRLQEEVWGGGFKERVPAAILMVANRLGGLAAGAFRGDGGLDGFIFGLTGMVDGVPVHWSDMLAVRHDVRDGGLGTRLKHYQRETLLRRGVRRMHWTFDPLQGRNAFINFAKLGIVSTEYVRDMYGETDSPLHRGIGTDRLVATWDMDSPRVEGRMAGTDLCPHLDLLADLPRVLSIRKDGEFHVPVRSVLDLAGPRLLLPVPGELERMMEMSLPLAIRWRNATRETLTHYMAGGYRLLEFVRGPEISHYLLDRRQA